MNSCYVTAEILEPFVHAVAEGGVRYWDVGNNKFGVDGIKMITTVFMDKKPETKLEKDGDSGRSTPASVVSSTATSAEEGPARKLECLNLEGIDLSSHQLDPLLDFWLHHPNLTIPLSAIDLSNTRLGRDIPFLTRLFAAFQRFPNLRILSLSRNPLFSNPNMVNFLREWLPRLPVIRRLDFSSTGMEAKHLVELALILPDIKPLATLSILNNPIYEISDPEEMQEGQVEDVSGLTALEAAMKYCRQIIEVELPEGEGDEVARLRRKIFLRCFKNIELIVQVVANDTNYRTKLSNLACRLRSYITSAAGGVTRRNSPWDRIRSPGKGKQSTVVTASPALWKHTCSTRTKTKKWRTCHWYATVLPR
jgi:hypothetical protein